LAGRLDALSRRPDPVSADVFIDEDFSIILNLLLYGVTDRPGEERSNFLQIAAEAGRAIVPLSGQVAVHESSVSPSLRAALLQASVRKDSTNGAAQGGEPSNAQPEPVPDEPRTPEAPRFPRNQDRLRELLAERLELLDLVVLDPVDMVQLRRSPEVAAIFGRYVASGGSLFAYVSATGDYRQVIGAPIFVESLSKPTRRLDLA